MAKKVVILIEDQFEDIEAVYPYYRLTEQGYDVEVVGPQGGVEYRGKHGMILKTDKSSREADIDGVVALIIPGGYAPDRIVRDKDLVDLVIKAANKCIIIAAICHGPLVLVETEMIRGKDVTGFKSIRTPLKLAGGILKDDRVVTDENIITAQDAGDVLEFSKALITLIEAYN